MLTINDVKEYITETYGEDVIADFGQAIMTNDLYDFPDQFVEVPENRWSQTDGQLTIYPVAHYGGEDQGSEYWGVVKFEMNGESCHARVDGWYASYHGYECDDYSVWKEVTPQEKRIIVYE